MVKWRSSVRFRLLAPEYINNMKVVKLNKTHHLYHYGYVVALRFNSTWSKGAQECRNTLKEKYGMDFSIWHHYRASQSTGPYWIGLKDEKMMTFLLLAVDLTDK